MSTGYSFDAGGSNTLMLAWDKDSSASNTGNALQSILDIPIPAGKTTKDGQMVVVEIAGTISNTGNSALYIAFDGFQMSSGETILPIVGDFYIKGEAVAFKDSDYFLFKGISNIAINSTNVIKGINLTSNSGGNTIDGPHTIQIMTHGLSGALSVELTKLSMYLVDSTGINLYP